ncbi:hypothetical protein SAMN02745196_00603 [Clostridium collagenovorans DSM 3089]|uniref:Uncharacterized protein n=1 Tax=Clostridium collagenovorans DSM 3089 TaxID=1121306 RepID=A0A1M5TJ60_9CLOT|nr:DUF6762 family protein [Clostridium collagenovorans]SHH50718.1 hypothetical protein SAMN02745196_00603 [Clostridium collagenovorans DSM 3089]
MENELIVLIEKEDKTNNFLREVTSFALDKGNLVHSLYMVKENDKYIVHMLLTTDRDVEEWEFEAIYDYYEDENLKDTVSTIEDADDYFNPTWHITLPYNDDRVEMEILLDNILNTHFETLENTYELIKENKEDYI